ncbi:MAG: hypothetical protein JW797_13180 [Bradymonadales bacterium]|nr:hypothetical protein [Bradymonadales bacterium]
MRSTVVLSGFLALACVLMSVPAQAGDWVDTRLTFIFSDDNLLAGPGETLINSPGPDFGPREGNFFPFENLDTQDSGQETLSHLVLYGAFPGFSDRLLTEAALVLRADLWGRGSVSFRDDGSYIKLTTSLQGPVVHPCEDGTTEVAVPDRNLELTLFPFTSERFRLGYQYDLSWGDQGIFTELSDRPVPALRLQYNDGWGYGFVGAKTVQQLQAMSDPDEPGNNELSVFYGVLGGLGLNLGEMVMVEANGGYFQSGTNRKSDVLGEPIDSGGGSVRVSLFDGISPGTSVDFRLYQNTPELVDSYLLREPSFAGQFSWLVSAEFSYLVQTLGDPDVVGGTTNQPAMAGALNLDASIYHWDFQVDLVYRDLAYMLRNVPSLDPMNAFPEDSEQDPEILAALSGQYYIPGAHLSPGFLVGVQLPAAYRGLAPTLPATPDVMAGEQTVVIRSARNYEPLPPGEDVLPVYSAKLSLRWDLSQLLSIIAQAQYSRDPNSTRLEDNEFGYATRVFRDPDILGFAILSQARF